MLETHPLGSFVPPKAKYLILGSFVTKEAYDDKKKASYIWFYANGGRNQFWPILESIYKVSLKTKKEMQRLLAAKGIAMADIIYQCERRHGTNLDTNLINAVYNIQGIEKILAKNKIEKIYFTSRFVEERYKRFFKTLITKFQEIGLITLPSPSPRYAAMSRQAKIKKYRRLLPKK